MNTRLFISENRHTTIIDLPELARLSWGDRVALRVSIWLIQRTIARSETHVEVLIDQHTAKQIADREVASLHWLPPR